MQKKKRRVGFLEKMRRLFMSFGEKRKAYQLTREFMRWENGWKRNAVYKGKPLTRSMRRRVGSRYRAVQLGLIKA